MILSETWLNELVIVEYLDRTENGTSVRTCAAYGRITAIEDDFLLLEAAGTFPPNGPEGDINFAVLLVTIVRMTKLGEILESMIEGGSN